MKKDFGRPFKKNSVLWLKRSSHVTLSPQWPDLGTLPHPTTGEKEEQIYHVPHEVGIQRDWVEAMNNHGPGKCPGMTVKHRPFFFEHP